MARIRSIYPTFKHDAKVKRLSREARLLFVLMLPDSDDEGRMPGSGKWLAGTLYEDDDDVTATKVLRWLDELIREGMVRPYEVDGAKFLHIVNFKRYQHPKKPSPSKFPPPPGTPPSTPPSTPPGGEAASPLSTPTGGEAGYPPDIGDRKEEIGDRREEVGSRNKDSSSSHLRVAGQQGDDEDEDVFAQACQMLAQRALVKREAERGGVGDERAWLAKATKQRMARHGAEAKRVLAASPALSAVGLADALEPGSVAGRRGRHPEPMESTAAAQRERVERAEARARGEACEACEGAGMVLGDDDVAVVCQSCGPTRLSVVGD